MLKTAHFSTLGTGQIKTRKVIVTIKVDLGLHNHLPAKPRETLRTC